MKNRRSNTTDAVPPVETADSAGELKKRRVLEARLDQELEDTFPASDATAVTRDQAHRVVGRADSED